MIGIEFALRTQNIHEFVHVGFDLVDHVVVVRLDVIGETTPRVERRLGHLVRRGMSGRIAHIERYFVIAVLQWVE